MPHGCCPAIRREEGQYGPVREFSQVEEVSMTIKDSESVIVHQGGRDRVVEDREVGCTNCHDKTRRRGCFAFLVV